MKIFLNDRLVNEEDAMVSVYDHGFLYGDGIYETMRAYDGVVFMLERHIQRLRRSASMIRLDLPEDGFIRNAIYETIGANMLREAYVRVTVSRGKGPIGLDPALCKRPTFVVVAEQFRQYPQELYDNGVDLIIAKTKRNLTAALDPRIKSLNFLNNILAKIEAKDRGAYEAVMLNAEGYIAEGTISNIFFVKDGVLCAPSKEAGVLDGITREIIISLARNRGIEVNEGFFLPADLFSSAEVFFSNTTAELMPVSRIEDSVKKPGPVTRGLHALYKQEVAEYVQKARRH